MLYFLICAGIQKLYCPKAIWVAWSYKHTALKILLIYFYLFYCWQYYRGPWGTTITPLRPSPDHCLCPYMCICFWLIASCPPTPSPLRCASLFHASSITRCRTLSDGKHWTYHTKVFLHAHPWTPFLPKIICLLCNILSQTIDLVSVLRNSDLNCPPCPFCFLCPVPLEAHHLHQSGGQCNPHQM